MAIKDRLAAELDDADTDETDGDDSPAAATDRRVQPSPFSMDYDLDSYSIDSDDMNNVLTALVAVTNLI